MEGPSPKRTASLAVALDLPPAEARAMGARLAAEVGFLKVGLSLFCSEGPAIVRELKGRGARVFLDLKLHDIPNTVEAAARAAATLGVELLTVHASGGAAMVHAAVAGASAGAKAAGFEPPKVLAVTVLTSLDEAAMAAVGLAGPPLEAVERLARLAARAGASGVVCSPREAAAVRRISEREFLVVTPGIRPAGAAVEDQARAETPEAALAAGADVLVVGRPILLAADPVAAARALAREIARGVA